MMNPNSLNNLKKEKPVHHEYEKGYKIPLEKIDKLFTLLASDKSLTKAAEEAGVAWETAKKYFEEGDPKRGITPLKQRLLVFREKISEKFTEEFLKRQTTLIKIVRDAIDMLKKQLELDVKDAKGLTSKASYASLERMIKLEVSLMGKPDKIKDIGLLDAESIKALTEKNIVEVGSGEPKRESATG